MSENNYLQTLILDIDKIINNETLDIKNTSDEEYRELLIVAQLLAKADYSEEHLSRKDRVWANIIKRDELEDDELDMVAGGMNLSEVNNKKEKK